MGSPIPAGTVSQANPDYEIANVAPFFKNPEVGETLTYSVEVEDAKVASAAFDDTDTTMLTVTRSANGSTMVTVTATEPETDDFSGPRQSAMVSFMVTATD